jgi:hypothetical protein
MSAASTPSRPDYRNRGAPDEPDSAEVQRKLDERMRRMEERKRTEAQERSMEEASKIKIYVRILLCPPFIVSTQQLRF